MRGNNVIPHGVLFFPLVAVLSLFSCSMHGQCAQQPPNAPISVPRNAVVYYQLDASLQSIPPGPNPPPVISQIQAAFNAWSVGNSGAGGSGATFALADDSHPATITVSADFTGMGPAAAITSALSGGLITASNPATITFYPNAFISGTSFQAFQAAQPLYNSAYLVTALHELAHINGIGDYQGNAPPKSPTSSVAEPTAGINDISDAYPKTGPTECDIEQATRSANLITIGPAKGAPGGGTGGDNDVAYYFYDGVGCDDSSDIYTEYYDGTEDVLEENVSATSC